MANLYSLHVGNNSGLCGDVPAGLGARLGGGNATQLNSSCYWEPDGGCIQANRSRLSIHNPDTNAANAAPVPYLHALSL